jgi:hypothetical protein
MGAISSKLRNAEGGELIFWCPGCDGAHSVRVGDGPGPRWTWNGSADRPTFTPSILVRYEHWVPPASAENPDPGPQTKRAEVCHSFVTDGQIQFLDDCTHALAGQTVPLPDNW